MSIENNIISGTLNYITDYTEFSSDANMQSGNYLALKVETNRDGATTTVELVGGTNGGPVTLDSNMNIVVKITDIESEYIRVITTKNGDSLTKNYSLSGLTLEEEVAG